MYEMRHKSDEDDKDDIRKIRMNGGTGETQHDRKQNTHNRNHKKHFDNSQSGTALLVIDIMIFAHSAVEERGRGRI